MIVYSYDEKGDYIGTTLAQESPEEPGKFLIPKNATIKPPPNDVPSDKKVSFVGGKWVIVDKEVETPHPEDELTKLEALSIKKAEIDIEKEKRYKQLFSFNETSFYPDERLANAIMTSIQYKDESYSIDIKSAEKLSDGVSNKFVTMDKATALQFAASLLERQKAIWEYGCRTLKDQLNMLYTDKSVAAEDILNFDVSTGWPV